MSAHTPGPWSRSWVYGAIRHINKSVDDEAFWSLDEGEDPETAKHPNVRSNINDADLITAAPDLYAACKDMLAAKAGLPKSCGHEYECVCPWDAGRAAIAKAEAAHG